MVKAGEYNGKTLTTPIFTLTEDQKESASPKASKGGFIRQFAIIGQVLCGDYPRLRLRFLALFVIWFINTGSFYGMTLNIKNLGGNFYMNILLTWGCISISSGYFLSCDLISIMVISLIRPVTILLDIT